MKILLILTLKHEEAFLIMYFEIYQSGGEWRWRLKAGNHEIIAHGESYKNKNDCLHAIGLVKSTNSSTPVHEK